MINMLKYLLFLVLISACSIEMEPTELVDCKHEIYLQDNKLHIKVKSNEPFVDICISTSRRDVTCRQYRAIFYDCISLTPPDGQFFVEIYSGDKYCCEQL